jgi:glycosyltransferase involved in cell wall biosynthesis
MENNLISIVIPVYNSEQNLPILFEKIQTVFNTLPFDFEIIFVNDYSRDSSQHELNKLHDSNNNITVIELSKNFGQQNAIMCGFGYVSGRLVLTMDDDLQNTPEAIPEFIRKIEEGYDCVIAAFPQKKGSKIRGIGSQFIRKINHYIFKPPKDLKITSYRMIRRELVDQLASIRTPYPYITGMILNMTKNIANIEVEHQDRQFGQSNYSLKKLIKLSFNLIINYSSIPLKLISYTGIIVSIVLMIIGMIFLLKQLINGNLAAGWTSLFVSTAFFNMIIFFMFSVISLYIVRMMKDISGQNQYYIKAIKKKKES